AVAASAASASAGYRPYRSFRLILPERILTSPTALAYFEAHGMPDPPGAADVFVRNGDPRLARLRAWAIGRGVSTYERFLVTHPGVALRGPIDDYRQLLAPAPDFAPAGFSVPASGAFVAVSPRTIGELIPWGAAIAALAVGAFALGP